MKTYISFLSKRAVHTDQSSFLHFESSVFDSELYHLYYCVVEDTNRSRNSAVGIETGYELDDRGVGVRVPVRARIFSSPRGPDRIWSPPNLLSNGYRGLFPPGLKRPGREADHSTPTSTQVKKRGFIHHSSSCLHGVVLN
jgi:hypothetical protein